MEKIIEEIFPKKRVLIVGDLVADQFLHGMISRVSREAPVFILRHEETETLPGGAANAAQNVASLGGRAVLIGIIGKDQHGEKLLAKLKEKSVDCSGVVTAAESQTTTKVRVLAGQNYAPRQQVIRIDYENQGAPSDETMSAILKNISLAAGNADAIILSDYSYGVASGEVFDLLKEISARKGIPFAVDSRFNLESMKGATSATPNQEEAEQIMGTGFSEQQCHQMRERLGLDALLITKGNKGMLLIEKGREAANLEVIGSNQPLDVTGAGDTVIAAYSLALASGMSFRDAAMIANHAGGIVVMKRGTATASGKELLDSVKNNEQDTIRANS